MKFQLVSPRGGRGEPNRGGERDCPLHVARAIISIAVSLTLCLSAPSSCLPAEASAQLVAPSQPDRLQPPVDAQPNLSKIRQQQHWQRQLRYPRESSSLAAQTSADASKNATNKQTTPSFRPPLLLETTTAQAPRFGLIARTSDAIYKTLSGYFSHEDEDRADERPAFGSKIATTPPTSAAPKMTTKWPETTTNSAGNSNRRTTLTGGGGVLATTSRPPPPPAGLTTRAPTTLANVRSTPPVVAPQTTSAPQSRLTTVPHLDLGGYTDQTKIASTEKTAATPIRASSSSGPRQTSTKTPRHATTTLAPPIASSSSPRLEETTTTSGPQQPRPLSENRPSSPLNFTALTPTQARPPPPAGTGLVTQRAEFFSFLSQAIKSVYSLNEFAHSSGNRNRSTRLAPPHSAGEHEGEHESEESGSMASARPEVHAPSDKLVQATNESQRQQVVGAGTREDILLLCKLLHKHLESGRKNEDGSVTLTLDGPLAANLSAPAPSPGGATSTAKPVPPRGETRPAETPQGSVSAGARLISDPQRELSELQHEDRLLESTFALELRPRENTSRSHEQVAEELLGNLYNLGHRRRQRLRAVSEHVERVLNDTHEDENSGPFQPEVDAHPLAPGNISLRVWSRTTTGGGGGGGGGHLKLVYWLIERVRVPGAGREQAARTGGNQRPAASIKYKVLDLQEAGELLDQLDHAHVQQLIDALALVRPIVLVAAHRRASVSDDVGNQVAPPLVLDDSLAPNSTPGGGGGGVGGEPTQINNNRTTLHLLVDRLTQSSFSDNLYLYSILFLLALFLLIMCFAVPALCCKCMMPASVAGAHRPGGRRADGRLPAGGRRNRQRAGDPQSAPYNDRAPSPPGAKSHFKSTDRLRESISSISGALGATNGKQLNEGAIWRKLSNSTTTLTKDQTRSLEDDGQVSVGVISTGDRNRQQQPPGRQNGSNKFEWYTFEDNQTLRKTTSGSADSQDKPSQTLVVRDRRKVTKSIQTYLAAGDDDSMAAKTPPVTSPASGASGQLSDSIDREHLSMAYRDRLETRNSDTLTKSELVMLKEKLIPIGRELRTQQEQQAAAAATQHDYVNTGPPRGAARQVARHIDSASVESAPGEGERNGNGTGTGSGNHGRNRNVAPGADESQRAPSMRYLELPAGAQTRASGSVRDELEARDSHGRNAPAGLRVPAGTSRPAGGDPQQQLADATYKRYDVI